jgi:hypothetical protein
MGNELENPLAGNAVVSLLSRNTPDIVSEIVRLAAGLSVEERLDLVNRILASLAEPSPPAQAVTPEPEPGPEVPVVRLREAADPLALEEFPEVEATMDVPAPDSDGQIDLDKVVARYNKSIEETMVAWREGLE